MEKQLIITVGREFGSGGHAIAEILARRFDIPMYDRILLERVAAEKNVDKESLAEFDEIPRSLFFSRTVRGFSNSMQENVANMQFDYLRRIAKEGYSFVIVGRCAEYILAGTPGLVTIFIHGDSEAKTERIMTYYEVDRSEAVQMIKKADWQRKSYHNYYSKGKWGDSRNYDLSINSSRLGIDGTADILERYIRARIGG